MPAYKPAAASAHAVLGGVPTVGRRAFPKSPSGNHRKNAHELLALNGGWLVLARLSKLEFMDPSEAFEIECPNGVEAPQRT